MKRIRMIGFRMKKKYQIISATNTLHTRALGSIEGTVRIRGAGIANPIEAHGFRDEIGAVVFGFLFR